MKRLLAALLLPGLAGCGLWNTTPPALEPVADVKFTIGTPYQAGGVWQYPRADFTAELTGLAVIATEHPTGHPGLTADGELFDQTALAAGHRTLQLPAIIRVTNLENGRQVVLRLNDRGPDHPGRLIALTRRASELLAVQAAATRVRVQVVEDQSRLLALSLQGSGATLEVAAAPRDDVAAEALAPPDGVSQSGRVRVATTRAAPRAASSGAQAAGVPLRLPEEIMQVYAAPGSLYVDVGTFSRADAASILANRLAFLGARITTSFTAPRVRAYRVRIGPIDDVVSADVMLQRALGAGVPDAAIVVE
jgi:rare lipoprotein A